LPNSPLPIGHFFYTMQILKELEALIPPLTSEEFKQLERNILEEGIRDPLVTWNGILVDGHNRYRIAQEYDIDFTTVEKEFADMNDVKIWMATNQLGRRNLSDYVKGELGCIIRDLLKEKGIEEKSKAGGDKKSLLSIVDKSDIKNIDDRHNTQKEFAEKIGWSTGKVAMFDVVKSKAPEEIKVKLRTGEVSINQAYKEIKKEEVETKRKEIRETFEKQDVEVKDKKYRIIYADPPWKYGNAMPEYVTEPQDYYLLMNTEDICAMPIKDITEKDAVLFLWSTSPHLPEALEVAKAWGFTYKTTFIWDKIKHNMGHYNSVRHEILLVCTKGACTPDVKRLFDSVVSEERTEHSKKPNVFREIIETIYTYGNKIELFARESPEGWDVFGNQTNK
jgi:N6-adenosine-specific RNA methylase IME4/ParB-like chromosome segregation protein Spo0J